MGLVSPVVDVTLSLDTNIYADGEVLADTQAVVVFQGGGQAAYLHSLEVIDEDDQGVAMEILFLDANNSIGTENSAPNITDANARAIIGRVSIAAADYYDIINSKRATKTGLGMAMKAASGNASLYVAVITEGGTPTHTAAGVRLKLGFVP